MSNLFKTVSAWESAAMIPVLLELLKEKWKDREADKQLQSRLEAYQEQCHRWQSANLNPRQGEWLQEIQATLNALQRLPFQTANPTS